MLPEPWNLEVPIPIQSYEVMVATQWGKDERIRAKDLRPKGRHTWDMIQSSSIVFDRHYRSYMANLNRWKLDRLIEQYENVFEREQRGLMSRVSGYIRWSFSSHVVVEVFPQMAGLPGDYDPLLRDEDWYILYPEAQRPFIEPTGPQTYEAKSRLRERILVQLRESYEGSFDE